MGILPRFAFRVNGSVVGGTLSGKLVVRYLRVKLGFLFAGCGGCARVAGDGWCECACWFIREGFRWSLAVVLRGLELLVMENGMIEAGVCELFRGAMYMSAETERGAACSGHMAPNLPNPCPARGCGRVAQAMLRMAVKRAR